MTTVCVVQARFGSSRLPGKVLEVVAGAPMLLGILGRLSRSTLIDEVIVATTTSDDDDPLVNAAERAGFAVVRGSVYDVLDRFHDVLIKRPHADVIVRITADCPFIDPVLVDKVICAREESSADFAANRLPPPYRRTYPVGLDVEVCTATALSRAWAEASEPYLREHVMPYIYLNPASFSVQIVDLEEDLSTYRWTVDTPEDLEAMREISRFLPHGSTAWRDVLEVVRLHPELNKLNAGQTQKSLKQVDDRWRKPDS
ncbi:MAG: glycosyltransferase family protein [Kineosporiaceae bacterium]|nr:glycosyltransferase family protein [Aeromicrobium sp.]